MSNKKKIDKIVKSNLALGHTFQDILEAHGMESVQARRAARTITVAVEQHLMMLGNTFVEIGYEKCGRALWLEAKSLLNT